MHGLVFEWDWAQDDRYHTLYISYCQSSTIDGLEETRSSICTTIETLTQAFKLLKQSSRHHADCLLTHSDVCLVQGCAFRRDEDGPDDLMFQTRIPAYSGGLFLSSTTLPGTPRRANGPYSAAHQSYSHRQYSFYPPNSNQISPAFD